MELSEGQALELVRGMLVRDLGPDLTTRTGEQVVILTGNITEYPTAWLVPFTTRAFLDDGNFSRAIIPSVALVPKDARIRPHYPPTAIDVPEYLSKIESGEMRWSGQS